MTLLEKYQQVLLDLMKERYVETNEQWQHRLDQKIRDIKTEIAVLISEV